MKLYFCVKFFHVKISIPYKASNMSFIPSENASGKYTHQPCNGQLVTDNENTTQKSYTIDGKSGFPDSACLNNTADTMELSTEPGRKFELIYHRESVECFLVSYDADLKVERVKLCFCFKGSYP